MFNWFKKKEVFREICIPKIFLDNGIEFRYQHSIEIATIVSKNKSIIRDIRRLVKEYDIETLQDLSGVDLNNDSIKIYSLIGLEENQKMLIAILDPVKRGVDPKLIAYNLINTNRQRGTKKAVNF